MKIVRTGKRIITNSIQRAITAVLIKVIVATGVVSLIASYAFGQTSQPVDQPLVKILNSSISVTAPTRIQIIATSFNESVSFSVKKIILKTPTTSIKIKGSVINSTDLQSLSPGEKVEVTVHYKKSNSVGKNIVSAEVPLI